MWEMQWVGWVVSDVWVAGMLTFIVYLLLPDANSSQYAHAMQLPQDDQEGGFGGNLGDLGGPRDDVEEIEIELTDNDEVPRIQEHFQEESSKAIPKREPGKDGGRGNTLGTDGKEEETTEDL